MLNALKKYSNLIAFSHSVFALPYAIVGFLLAKREGVLFVSKLGFYQNLFLMLLAVVFARTAAMGVNRIADREIDAKNPRTENRELVTKEVSLFGAWSLVLASSFGFLAATYLIGPHCFFLAPAVLFVLFFYSFCKRFTSLAHFILGFSLSMAPGGAWWILRPEVEAIPIILMCAVLFWVSGFDILYSCQDVDFDKKEKLFSVPRRLGIKNSLRLAFLLHIFSFLAFLLLGLVADLSDSYSYGMLAIGLLLLGQHSLISEHDLKQINRAFFTFNGLVSISYLILVGFSL